MFIQYTHSTFNLCTIIGIRLSEIITTRARHRYIIIQIISESKYPTENPMNFVPSQPNDFYQLKSWIKGFLTMKTLFMRIY